MSVYFYTLIIFHFLSVTQCHVGLIIQLYLKIIINIFCRFTHSYSLDLYCIVIKRCNYYNYYIFKIQLFNNF